MAKHFTLEDVQAAVEDAITGGEYSIPKLPPPFIQASEPSTGA